MEIDNTILVIGACALDRLLHVPMYPKEDAKILCEATFEFGGGNAANTAAGLGRISNSTVLKQRALQSISVSESSASSDHSDETNIKIQLLSKIGDDVVKRRLCEELCQYSVDLSSKLFLTGPRGSTSPIATVIVSTSETHSRTCFFDKGTCGVLEACDVGNLNLDEFFSNVFMIHSDSRHFDAAVVLAKEARMRGKFVSVDLERDRCTKSFDDLIHQATTIFTNEEHIKAFVERRKMIMNDRIRFFDASDIQFEYESQRHRFENYIETAAIFYALMKLSINEDIELIITRGRLGALKCKLQHYSSTKSSISSNQTISETSFNYMVIKSLDDKGTIHLEQSIRNSSKENCNMKLETEQIVYEMHVVGPPILQDEVKDSTGAGDSFISGYLWSKFALYKCNEQSLEFDTNVFQLRMASWVAGKKLMGPGARATLPTSDEVDNELGLDLSSIAKSLESKVQKISFAMI